MERAAESRGTGKGASYTPVSSYDKSAHGRHGAPVIRNALQPTEELRGKLPAEDADVVKDAPARWKALFNFTTTKHLPILISAVIVSVIAGCITPAQAFLFGRIFNAFAQYGAGTIAKETFVHTVSKYCTYLTFLGAGNWLLNGGDFFLWLLFGELQAKSVRERLFNALLVKDVAWFDLRKNGISGLIPRLQMQTRELSLATAQPLGGTLRSIASGLSSLGLAFYYSCSLTLIILSTVPVLAIAVGWLSAKMQPAIESQQDELGRASKTATNAFTAIEIVKCFNGQEVELSKYTRITKSAARFYIRQANLNALQMAAVKLATLAMFVQGFWYGSTLVGSGKKDAGEVLTTFWAALMGTQAFQEIMPQFIVLEKGRAAGALLRRVVVQSSAGVPSVGKRRPRQCKGEIEVRNVTFAYPTRPKQMALRHATLYFPPGECTFVIGQSGSGKSTIGQLLMRFYDPGYGRICLDGIPLEDLDLRWLRSNITLVEQTSVLFEDTIYRNIAFGSESPDTVSIEDVKHAAELAMLQQTINDMPQGYQTIVSNKGSSLSGGQRQRLAIARARLRDTPVLILDESTSALDYISRALVLDAIRTWRRGKTTIIITHDISQIQSSDHVYILQDAQVVQEGYRVDMEKLRNTPFQDFAVSLEDSAPPEKQISLHDGSDLGSMSENYATHSPSSSDYTHDDLLDLPTRQLPGQQGSFIPTVWANRSGDSPALDGSPRLGGPASPFATPFWRPSSLILSQPDRLAHGKTSRSRSKAREQSLRQETASPEVDTSIFPSNDAKLPLEIFEMTAEAALEYRRRSKRPQRQQRLPSDGTGSERKPNYLPYHLKLGRRHKKKDKGLETDALPLVNILKTIWPRLPGKARFLCVLGFVAATMTAVSTPLFSWIFSKLLNTLYLPQDREKQALIWSMSILGLAIGDGIASYLMHILLEYCGQVWVDNVRTSAMKRILDQPREFFDREENSVSRLIESLDRNAEEMRNLLGRFAGFIYVAVIMMAVAVAWSASSSWKPTFVGLATAPILYLVTKAFNAVSAKLEADCNDAAEVIGAIFSEVFNAIKTVRALTLEGTFHRKHQKAVDVALKVGFRRAVFCGFFFGLTECCILFATALVFWYGAVLVSSGSSVAEVLEVFNMLLFAMSNAAAIVAFIPQMSSSRDTATRLLRLASLPVDSHEHDGNTQLPHAGNITLSNLTFVYPTRPGHTVLQGVNLTLEAGRATAIVGSSGSGKSTIAALLVKLYSAHFDERTRYPPLSISGRDLNTIHTSTLRNLVTIVAQQPVLFATTVADNIAYGLPPRSPNNTFFLIKAAAAAAGIDDFIISLPDGYHTLIGEGGIGLSGGQAQRISIARALVRQPSVLILDEATSALDVESAEVIRQTITRLKIENPRLTVIIITHAREMMEIADKVVVLDQGRVVEQGSWEELMRGNGAFVRLLSGGQWTGPDDDDADDLTKRRTKGKGKGKAKGLGIDCSEW